MARRFLSVSLGVLTLALSVVSCKDETTSPPQPGSVTGALNGSIVIIGRQGNNLGPRSSALREYPGKVYLLQDFAPLDSTTYVDGHYVFQNVAPGAYHTMVRSASSDTSLSAPIGVGEGEPDIAAAIVLPNEDFGNHFAYPNPAPDSLHFVVSLDTNAVVDLTLLSTVFAPLDTILSGIYPAGAQTITWPVALPNGLYWASLSIDGTLRAQQLIEIGPLIPGQ